MTTDQGTLYVFSGPSGTGKGTIMSQFNKQYKDSRITYSVSATTRQPRDGEVDGVNYFFVTKEQFMNQVEADGFLEWASFCDNCYGTPKAAVMNNIHNGTDVILEIEVQGALKVKSAYPDAVMIFVLPPSLAELKRRLQYRGTEPEFVVEKRFQRALDEIKLIENYDYFLINDDLDCAVSDFKAIVDAERLKVNKNKNTILKVCEL